MSSALAVAQGPATTSLVSLNSVSGLVSDRSLSTNQKVQSNQNIRCAWHTLGAVIISAVHSTKTQAGHVPLTLE